MDQKVIDVAVQTFHHISLVVDLFEGLMDRDFQRRLPLGGPGAEKRALLNYVNSHSKTVRVVVEHDPKSALWVLAVHWFVRRWVVWVGK